MRFLLAAFLLSLIACRTGLDLPATVGDHSDCGQWIDDTSCAAHGCAALDCPGCGVFEFQACYDPNAGVPSCAKPPSCPAECAASTAASCLSDPNCFVVYEVAPCGCEDFDCCPMVFDHCMRGPPMCIPGPNTEPCPSAPACDPGFKPVYPTGGGCTIGCVEAMLCDTLVGDCSSIGTQDACDANPACYSVVQPNLCNCNGPDCCPPSFLSCQTGPPQCAADAPPPPSCPVFAQCTEPYAVAYDSQGCPLGCVNETQCGGPQPD